MLNFRPAFYFIFTLLLCLLSSLVVPKGSKAVCDFYQSGTYACPAGGGSGRCFGLGPYENVYDTCNPGDAQGTSTIYLCGSEAEAKAECGSGPACTPATGICSGIYDSGSTCQQCTGTNTIGSPKNTELCCGDQFHLSCGGWNGTGCSSGFCGACNVTSGPGGTNCNTIGDSNTCGNTSGCSWSNYPANSGGGYCDPATCTGGNWTVPNSGSCADSCGGGHSCTPPPPPSWVQGYKVQAPGLTLNATPIAQTVSITPTGPDPRYEVPSSNYGSYKFNTWGTSNTLAISIPANYSVGYTMCNYGDPGCGSEDNPTAPADAHFGNITGLGCNDSTYSVCNKTTSNSVTVATPNPATVVNLWFHFCAGPNWQPGVCVPFSKCGPGKTTVTDQCGNTISDIDCSLSCTYFVTYGGNVTSLGSLTDYNLPASEFVCKR